MKFIRYASTLTLVVTVVAICAFLITLDANLLDGRAMVAK